METLKAILIPVLIVGGIALLFGVLLAIVSKVFAVKRDERIDQVKGCLPGANCGGCGYAGCDALAEAIVKGEASPTKCAASSAEELKPIFEIMGIKEEQHIRMRAQVMCSGTGELSKKKYIYEGAHDCVSAAKLGGGDRVCPNGCVGLGTCAARCPFHAIKVVDGVAVVDYDMCKGCGVCVKACPKHLITLIPFESRHWVGCKSVDKGPITKSYCDVGCVSCRLCEKNCPAGAITVNDFVASIDNSKCIGCDTCVKKCPRKIIWSSESQDGHLVIRREFLKPEEGAQK